MGYLLPTLLAFALNTCGVFIFHDASKAGCEPLISSLIFLFAVFILLWNLRLFPSSLRSLVRMAAVVVHFFLTVFFMEHVMNDFWFPLESSLFAFLPKVAEFEASVLKQFGWHAPGVLQFLKSDIAQVLASYALSLFFLACVMHSTRIIDLRLLRCGRRVFFEDISFRFRCTMRKFKKKFFKRAVKFQDNNCGRYDDRGRSRKNRKGHY